MNDATADTSLFQLAYTSRPVNLDQVALEALLAESRTRNAARGISGMLLVGEGRILQVLEGPRSVVTRLYQRIEADPRHEACRALWEREVRTRDFPGWSMGFAPLARERLGQLPGFVDFFSSEFDVEAFKREGGAARFLVLAFREG